MDQGIAVHTFERRRIQRPLGGAREQAALAITRKGRKRLPPPSARIAHRLQKPRRNRAKPLLRKPFVEMAFDTACMGFQAFCKIHSGTTFPIGRQKA